MKEKNEKDAAIGEYIRAGLSRSGMRQNELAKRIGIQPSSLNQMISGVAPLPLERFCQIISIIRLGKHEVNEAFAIYREKLSIPDGALAMLDCGWIQNRLKELLAMPEASLRPINRKEIEVIRYWNNGFKDEIEHLSGSMHGESSNEKLIAYAKTLSEEQSARALSVLKLMFGENLQ